MSRLDNQHPVFYCTCCACLLPLSLVKASLLVGPVLLIVVIPSVIASIFHLLIGLPVFIYATIYNQMLGVKAKIMLFLLLPIPVALYIPVVTIGSVLFGIGYGFFYPINLTFDDDYNPFGGCRRVFRDAGRGVREFVRGGFEFISDLKSTRNSKPDPGEVPVDLPFSEVLIGITMCVVGLCVIVPFWALIAVLKFLPAVLRLWGLLFQGYFEDTFTSSDWRICLRCCCFPFVLIMAALVPVFALGCLVVTLIHSIGVAFYSSVVAYQTESVWNGIRWMGVVIRQYDARTNGTLSEPHNLGRYTSNPSVFDCCCTCGREDEEMQYYLDRLCLTV